ncbi:hypothetical protein E0Z10_g10675 [Xylaria hypoxylon]|uniref:G domain-containing protein n=1 Tax=Xylaria hypoxylon TaxID=37992 RepID=A0A4Z0YJ12_9PEZI|nr:hypothetical protein E0Z10_g10675 [Xylaria hypoxylon]
MFAGVSKNNTNDTNDKFFLVVGVTGCGKSTFISRCTGKPVTVGRGLYSYVYEFTSNGQRIHLIDTPGFNDTSRSDIDILGILASWLGVSYGNGVRIHGLVILHSIADNRMSGSSMRNLAMLKVICGFTSYANVVIATGMWPAALTYAEKANLESREAKLLSDERFFGFFTARGARVLRHNEEGSRDFTREAASAKRIVNHLVQQSEMHVLDVLQLQREIVDEGKTLGETAAGIAAAGELYKERKAHEHQLMKLRAEITRHLDKSNDAYTAQLRELEVDAEKKLKKAQDDRHTLKQRMEGLQENELKVLKGKMEEMDRLFRKEVLAREKELREMEESLSEMRKDLARKSLKPRMEHEKAVSDARERVSRVRKAHQKFNDQIQNSLTSGVQMDNIINGAVNGISAGVTSAIVAAELDRDAGEVMVHALRYITEQPNQYEEYLGGVSPQGG